IDRIFNPFHDMNSRAVFCHALLALLVECQNNVLVFSARSAGKCTGSCWVMKLRCNPLGAIMNMPPIAFSQYSMPPLSMNSRDLPVPCSHHHAQPGLSHILVRSSA